MTTKRQTPSSFCHASILLFSLLLLLLSSGNFAGAQTPNGPADRAGFPNPNFKPSMSITIIVLIAAFVFMAFFSIYIRQCTRESRAGAGNIGPPAGAGRSRRTTRGLDPEEIGAFPTFVYSDVKGLKIGKGALECAVCLNEFEDDETLRLLPKCDHVFHPECIDAWLASHVTCPVCRANLVQKSVEDATGVEPSTEAATEAETESESENRLSDIQHNDQSQNHVSIPVSDDQNNAVESSRTEVTFPSRPVRSKSTGPRYQARFPEKFPRSHTTGHSLVPPGEDCERFTLRLPDDIRKQILDGKLNRTSSCVTFTTRQGSVSGGSVRRGFRIGGEGSSSGRGKNSLLGFLDRTVRPEGGGGVFSRTRSFFRRTPSVTLGKRVDGGSGSVKSPFDCIGPKADGDDQPPSSTRPPV